MFTVVRRTSRPQAMSFTLLNRYFTSRVSDVDISPARSIYFDKTAPVGAVMRLRFRGEWR